jgi:transposase
MDTVHSPSIEKMPEPQDWREWRRLRVLALHTQGWKQGEIAQAVGLSQGRVSQVLKVVREQGVAGLRTHKASGPEPKLNAAQRQALVALLKAGAEAFGFRGEVWTSPRVAEVIQEQFGVTYHPHHIPRLLRACGWSPQKPMVRASQRDEEKIVRWCEQRWPEIKKEPQPKGA